MKELLVKAGLTGLIGGIGAAMLLGNGDVQAFGKTMQAGLLTGGAVGVGSVISDLVSENIIENLDLPQNIKSTEEFLVRGSVCGLASSGVLIAAAGMPMQSLPISFAVGAGSKYAGDWAEGTFFGKKGIVPMY